MNTLYLNPATWDLAIDLAGNIAVASNPYALAQDAATAIETMLGECYYDDTLGIAWFQNVFGKYPPLMYIKAQCVAQALTVPGVVSAQAYILSFTARKLSGQVQITDASGVVTAANFSVGLPA